MAATGKHFLGYGLSEGGHNHKPAHLGAHEFLKLEVVKQPQKDFLEHAGGFTDINHGDIES